MTWDTTLAALHAWVVTGSQLSASNVRWSGQGGTRPTGSWISLRVISDVPIGHDWTDVTDSLEPIVDGAEIVYTVRGSRRGVLNIQCFAGNDVGVSSAFGILRRFGSAIKLPAARAILSASKVSLGSIGPVNDIPAIINVTEFEPRATLDIVFFSVDEVTETGTNIETVEITGYIDNTIITSTVTP